MTEEVAERARRFGPLRYDEVLQLALYDEERGFYGRGGGAGRGADFLTSPEVGPLFGAVLARAIDRWWRDLGEPDPFVVVEAGAGSGALAAAVLGASPACAPALRYVLVEASGRWRDEHARRIPIEPAGQILGHRAAAGSDGEGDDDPEPVRGGGPLLGSLAELPAGPFEGVVLANELLDNLPFRLFEHGDGRWREVRVGEDLSEVLVDASAYDAAELDRLAPEGGRVPLQSAAQAWLHRAFDSLSSGRVVVVDYASTTASMAARPWTEWVRTYRAHGRGGHPLEHLGEQDVTCDVAVDQLAHVRLPSNDRSQAEFLRAHGLDALVDDARGKWAAAAAAPDLAAMAARSRITEGNALTDPDGLGGFRVLEWVV